MRVVILLALCAAVALAAPGDKKILVCGARQQGVGGSMGTVLKNATSVQTANDCANLCIDTPGCNIYQWCGYGSYNGTCATVTGGQATKGDCFLGNNGWRQSGSARDVGGWTVGTGCSAVDAPADPETEGEKVEAEPAKPAKKPVAPVDDDAAVPPPAPKPAAPLAPRVDAPAEKPAASAGWAKTGDAAASKPLTDVVTPVRTPVARAPAAAGDAAAAVPAARKATTAAPVDDGMTVAAAPAAAKKATAAAAPAPAAPRKAAAGAPAAAPKKGATAAPAPAPASSGGKRLAGTALELQPDLSKEECVALCEGDKACKGWSWCAAPGGCGQYGARVCQPMTFTGPARYVEGDGWTSGLKEAATASAKSVEA